MPQTASTVDTTRVARARKIFADFAARDRRLALHWAFEILHNWEDVDDAVQNAFLAAARYIHTFNPDLPFAPWMRRIVQRACFAYLKSKNRNVLTIAPLEEADEMAVPDMTEQVADADERRELMEQIQGALQHLLPTQRWLLEVDFEEQPRAVIARHLRIGPLALNARLYRARQGVRELLGRNQEPTGKGMEGTVLRLLDYSENEAAQVEEDEEDEPARWCEAMGQL